MTSITTAQRYYRQGRIQDAAEICRQLVAGDPQHVDANNLLGIIEFRSGNVKTGLRHMQTVAEARPENVMVQCNLAQAFAQAGRLEDAVAVYRRALALDPANRGALASLVMVLQQLGRADDSERICRDALRSQPNDVALLLSLGTVLAMQGRHEAAIESLNKVLELEPGHPAAMANLANAMQETGRLGEALKLYRQVLSVNPRHLDALVNIGHVFSEKGDSDTALQSYQAAISVDPRCSDAHYYAGTIIQRRGEYDRAIEHFRSTLEIEPDFERAHWGLQQSFLLKEMPNKALEACEDCLAVLPDNQMTVANQAFAYLMGNDETQFDYLYDLEFFPYQVDIGVPDGFDSVASLNETLVRDIMGHPSLKWQHDDYNTSDRAFAYGILDAPTGAIKGFENALRASIDTFIAGIQADTAHPFFGRIPSGYDFRMWATVIQNGGWHRAHNHEKAWLSGVYYVQCPHVEDNADTPLSGWIEFDGFTHYGGNDTYGHKVRRVKPQPGLLLFFPSYMLHATRPFAGDGYRISIAFDVKPHRVSG